MAQPIHTLYGGAHLFGPQTFVKLQRLALQFWQRWCPTPRELAPLLGRPIAAALAADVHARVSDKLLRQPIEDYRIDFEDGFGPRPDHEEDAAIDTVLAALQVGQPLSPRSLGIRVRALGEATRSRALQTLERIAVGLTEARPEGRLIVTLPKVESVKEIDQLVRALSEHEAQLGLPEGYFAVELMIESPQAVLTADGRVALPQLVRAAGERLVALHVGAYDYTAALGVAAAAQTLDHGAVGLLRQLCQLVPDVVVADGATTLLPIGDDRATVLQATRRHARHIDQALAAGIYQGWDLHPAQLPIRFAATILYFRENLPAMAARRHKFLEQAAHATRTGAWFDDAATGRGLEIFMARGIAVGALDRAEGSPQRSGDQEISFSGS